MFFYASLRSALWISRASLYFDPLYTFVFPRARPRRRPFDAAANVFWDLIEGAERRITKKYDFAIYAFHPWNSIFRRSIDQRVITLSALATTTSHAILFAFAFLYLSRFVANAFWDPSYNNKSISSLSFQDWRLFFVTKAVITSSINTSLPRYAISKLCTFAKAVIASVAFSLIRQINHSPLPCPSPPYESIINSRYQSLVEPRKRAENIQNDWNL